MILYLIYGFCMVTCTVSPLSRFTAHLLQMNARQLGPRTTRTETSRPVNKGNNKITDLRTILQETIE
jgi:hypothetical protein